MKQSFVFLQTSDLSLNRPKIKPCIDQNDEVEAYFIQIVKSQIS